MSPIRWVSRIGVANQIKNLNKTEKKKRQINVEVDNWNYTVFNVKKVFDSINTWSM